MSKLRTSQLEVFRSLHVAKTPRAAVGTNVESSTLSRSPITFFERLYGSVYGCVYTKIWKYLEVCGCM